MRALNWPRFAMNGLDQRERHLDDVESIKNMALEPYATFRSLYRQHRRAQIEDARNDTRATSNPWHRIQ